MKNFSRRLFLTSIPFLLLAPVAVPLAHGAGGTEAFESGTHTQKGFPLPYRLLKPEKIEPGKKYPVVLFLHGMGERGTDNAAQLKNRATRLADTDLRAKHLCFLLVPQCPVSSFWGLAPKNAPKGDALDTALDLLDSTIRKYPIDKSRIYVMGLSMGGMATFNALKARPRFFAAALPISGSGDAKAAKSYSSTAVWIFHGEKDTIVNPQSSRDIAAALKKAGSSKSKITLFPSVGHDAWTPALRGTETWDWLFAQKR
jgi:predicted peptidase